MNHAAEFETGFAEECEVCAARELEEEKRRSRRPGRRLSGRPAPDRANVTYQRPPGYTHRPVIRPKKPVNIQRNYTRIVSVPSDCSCSPPAYSENGSEYVRWVQKALNQILGVRLPVTGFMNVETRSALRRFQEKQGLPIDGIAGPETKEALVAARRGEAARSEEPNEEIGAEAAIEDHTHLTPVSKRVKGKERAPGKVYALVLHQMAFSRGNDPAKYHKVGAHFAIMPNGKIIQLHPISAYLNASNGFNPGSVAVEFAGNFPDTRGRCWESKKFGCHRVTPEQINAGRTLIEYLIQKIGLTHVLAHRQASGTRTNDPGPDIWYHVGQWAVDNLGLKDGGPGFWIRNRIEGGTDGKPIPDLWRTWGKTVKNEARSDNEFNFSEVPGAVLEALRKGLESVALRLAVNWGLRDETKLTNLVFFARHPERGGQKLVQNEPDFSSLSKEWLEIRDQLIRPLLKTQDLPKVNARQSGKERIRKLALAVEQTGTLPGFAAFATAAAYTESSWNHLAANRKTSEAAAACKLYEGAKTRGFYGNNPYPKEKWCFGSGGWFGLMPASGLAAGGINGPFAESDPSLIFDPAASVAMLADLVVRIVNKYGAKDWLAVRRGMASVRLINDTQETKQRSIDVRKRFTHALMESGIDPSFMNRQVDTRDYPGVGKLYSILIQSK